MPDIRLFQTDPYLTDLETTIVSSRDDKKGIWYSFDETIFYPQGGGQSSDKGWINSDVVLDVQSDSEYVWHLISSPLKDPVQMKLDWDYRFTNMQQHTGQHILSACFKTHHDLDTVSVHLGTDVTMIELDTPSVEENILIDTEIAANKMIRENLPVQVHIIKRTDLDKYNLRRELKTDEESVRLVQIGEADCVGCGGTHVRMTGEVGLIKILGVEKIRGHARIKIKIGSTAYHYFHQLHKSLNQISTKLTTSLDDLPEKIDVMNADKRELIGEKKHLTTLWLSEFVKNLDHKSSSGCFALKELNKDQLKILSEQYLQKYNVPCLFLSEESDRIHFYIRISAESKLDVQDFVNENRAKYFMKGGGGKDFAVGQIDLGEGDSFSEEALFLSFKSFIQERSG